MNRLRMPVTCALSMLIVALAQGQASAQLKPFRIIGSGIAPEGLPLPGQPPRSHPIEGNASYMGLHTGNGTVQTDSAALDPSGKIVGEFGSGGPYTFENTKGDKLVCYYGRTDFGAAEPGRFELTILGVTPGGDLIVEALFIAEFVAQPELCAGKFAGVTGSWIMYAYSEPFILGASEPLAYSWRGHGALTFKK